ncbi:MAG TPA: multidrug efflux SMR transporter [Burkholderiaceae bacterium]|jgi:quaternary ammonium compound-resistance protein SugE|nr:multidrug efflux SMR transporter [Burkholderiaceae bacterium]
MTERTRSSAGKKGAWTMLLLASAFEIGYALSVGASQAFTVLTWSVSAGVFFLLTLYALSVALRSIDVGIGYAVWAGIGAVGAAVCGSALLDQQLTLAQALWLAVIIGGVVWLKLTDSATLHRART